MFSAMDDKDEALAMVHLTARMVRQTKAAQIKYLLRARKAGCSLRELAVASGLSHMTVKYMTDHAAVTKSGKVLGAADFEALADEAEAGYDVEDLRSAPDRADS